MAGPVEGMAAERSAERPVQCGETIFPEDARAAERFDALADQMGGADALRPQDAILIADLVRNEELKEQLRRDIQKRGVGEMVRNGRQSYWRDNKSMSLMLKLADQQRRTLQALGLIAKPRDQSDSMDDDDGFDEF